MALLARLLRWMLCEPLIRSSHRVDVVMLSAAYLGRPETIIRMHKFLEVLDDLLSRIVQIEQPKRILRSVSAKTLEFGPQRFVIELRRLVHQIIGKKIDRHHPSPFPNWNEARRLTRNDE